jgi:hypothetical protein
VATPIEIGADSHKQDVHSIVLSQLGRLDGAIEKEFTLVSDRMVWMVISESFIFGAFTTAVVNYEPNKTLCYAILVLIAALPVLGVLIADLARRAINAAHTAADRLKDERERLERMFVGQLRVDLISSKLETHAAGNLPPKLLPRIITLAWAVFLIVAAVQLVLVQTAAAIVTACILAVFLGAVLYIISRSAVARVEELEQRVRLLESARHLGSAAHTPNQVLQQTPAESALP